MWTHLNATEGQGVGGRGVSHDREHETHPDAQTSFSFEAGLKLACWLKVGLGGAGRVGDGQCGLGGLDGLGGLAGCRSWPCGRSWTKGCK